MTAPTAKRLVFRRRAEGAHYVLAFAIGMALLTAALCSFVSNPVQEFFDPLLDPLPLTSAILFAVYGALVTGQPGLVVDLDAGEVRDLPGFFGRGPRRRWSLAQFTGVSLRH